MISLVFFCRKLISKPDSGSFIWWTSMALLRPLWHPEWHLAASFLAHWIHFLFASAKTMPKCFYGLIICYILWDFLSQLIVPLRNVTHLPANSGNIPCILSCEKPHPVNVPRSKYWLRWWWWSFWCIICSWHFSTWLQATGPSARPMENQSNRQHWAGSWNCTRLKDLSVSTDWIYLGGNLSWWNNQFHHFKEQAFKTSSLLKVKKSCSLSGSSYQSKTECKLV